MAKLARSVAGLNRIMEVGDTYEDALVRQSAELTELLSDLEARGWKPIMMSGNPEQGITVIFE